MHTTNDTPQTFRLSDLEMRLKELLPNKDDLVHAYYCCENIGKPIPSADNG